MGLEQSLLGAFGAGVLSFLSPCILPLVPPYLCFLTGLDLETLEQGQDAPLARPALQRAILFVVGFSTVFVALGATASTLGQWLTVWFDTLSVMAGGLILAMGLHFLGVFRIGLLFREVRFQTASRPVGWLGAYVVGLAFAFGWTPCVGPVLATILLVAGAQESAGQGTALLAAYAAGIGLPFLGAAAFTGLFLRILQRFRRHLGVVEKAMGGVLAVTGVLFMTGSMPAIGNWLLDTFPVLGRVG